MSSYRIAYWRKGYGVRVWLSFTEIVGKYNLEPKDAPDSSTILTYANFYNPQVQS